jgi:2-desacetyl-2-hydroxyethyl bacteriochlorophyllide A dehydrogenase
MKALVYLGPRWMEVQDAPEPAPAPGEARVRVSAAAICGSDLHGFREPSPRRIPPLVMGHEVAGVVDAVGGDVDHTLEGTRVVAMPVVSCGTCARCLEGRPNVCPTRRLMGMDFPGAFADAFTIPVTQLLRVPDHLDDATASLTEPLGNALHVVARAVGDGDRVLVIGAGAIGLFAARAALLAGASIVLVTDTQHDRLQRVEKLGAEPIEAGAGAAGAVAEMTNGDGVDVVIDAAGFPATWALALDVVRYGGRVDVIGLGAPEGPVSYHTIVAKALTVAGAYACVEADFDRALDLLASEEVDVADWITTMPLTEGQSAFEALVDEGRDTKVVLLP